MTLSVHGLNPIISSFVARHRERRLRATFFEPIQFARAEGDAVRARDQRRRSAAFASKPLRKNSCSAKPTTSKLLHLQASQEYEEVSLAEKANSVVAADDIQYLDYTGQSIPTQDLPDAEPSCEGEELLAMESWRPPYRPYRPTMIPPPWALNQHNRVGWIRERGHAPML